MMDEDVPPSPEGTSLQLSLESFEGPLDLLLDLARRQRVDLARISLLDLVDQYVAAISGSNRVDVSRAAEWLVMAAWLTWLKSRLLLPKHPEEAAQAEQAANILTGRLAELDRVSRTVEWLEARPHLGRDFFERGQPDVAPIPIVTASSCDLMVAVLDILLRTSRDVTDRLEIPLRDFWTPRLAMEHMRHQLQLRPEGGELLDFVPRSQTLSEKSQVQRAAAVAAALIASLELTRQSEADLEQDDMFGMIVLRAHAEPSGQSG